MMSSSRVKPIRTEQDYANAPMRTGISLWMNPILSRQPNSA